MIEVIPFQKEDCKKLLAEQPEYLSYLSRMLTEEFMDAHAKSPYSFSIRRVEDKKPLAVAGITMFWPGRGEAWTIFASDLKRELVLVHREIKRYLDRVPVKRIEAAIDYDQPVSHRWIKSLGFKLESLRLVGYRPDGGDASMYVLIKGDS